MNTGLRLKSTRSAGPGGTGLQFWLLATWEAEAEASHFQDLCRP